MTTIGTTEKIGIAHRASALAMRPAPATGGRFRLGPLGGGQGIAAPCARAGRPRCARRPHGLPCRRRSSSRNAELPPRGMLRLLQRGPARCRASCTIRPAWWSVRLGLRWIAAITPQRSARMVTLRSRSLGASARSAYVQAALRRRARCRSASGRAAARTGPRRRSRPARARRARRSRRGAATRSRPCSCAGGRVAGPGRACRR